MMRRIVWIVLAVAACSRSCTGNALARPRRGMGAGVISYRTAT
jgi:hypothetical protein